MHKNTFDCAVGEVIVEPLSAEEIAEIQAAAQSHFLARVDERKQAVREARKPVFYTLAGMQSEALAKGDTLTAASIVGIQQALKDLPETDLSACTNVSEVDAAFVAAWQSIAESAPANVVSAFNEVLA